VSWVGQLYDVYKPWNHADIFKHHAIYCDRCTVAYNYALEGLEVLEH
jgi:hypothetical protein